MAQSNQSPGSLRGVTPLAYAGTTPNMVFNTRRPTIRDVFNFEIGTWWIIPKKKSNAAISDPTREVWILVGNAQQVASWKKLHGGAGPTQDMSIKITVLDTPGSGTFTFDPSMHQVQVECVGGGGASKSSESYAFGAGAGGGYCKKLFTASEIGTSQPFFIGSGGVPNVITPPFNGNPGESTTFGSPALLTAGGGSGGIYISGSGASGGIASGGDVNINGQDGQINGSTEVGSVTIVNVPGGGNSFMGMGGGCQKSDIGVGPDFTGLPGKLYGGGGGCPVGSSGVPVHAGGMGAQGVIIITEYVS